MIWAHENRFTAGGKTDCGGFKAFIARQGTSKSHIRIPLNLFWPLEAYRMMRLTLDEHSQLD